MLCAIATGRGRHADQAMARRGDRERAVVGRGIGARQLDAMKPIPQGANEVIGAAVDGRLYVYGGEENADPACLWWRESQDPAARHILVL